MRTIVHLSDLHFGRTDASLLDPLVAIVHSVAPDLVAVSGDLTQRARTSQFKQARRFLDRLPIPQVIVPGNHDVPLYDVLTRFTRPLAGYRRYITDDLEPWFIDDEIAVMGINTARSLTFKHGRISKTQIDRMEARMRTLHDGIVKIIVTHHPVDLPVGVPLGELVSRAARARESLLTSECDLLLAGHLHIGSAATGAIQFEGRAHSPIIVQAGTAASTRGRGESNSFNAIVIRPREIEVRRYVWQQGAGNFESTRSDHFERTSTGWKLEGPQTDLTQLP
jgi:3',5'-cyclic AMP phosphodiesterase CpdA